MKQLKRFISLFLFSLIMTITFSCEEENDLNIQEAPDLEASDNQMAEDDWDTPVGD